MRQHDERFLRERDAHLRNKRAAAFRRLRDDDGMPAAHRRWKERTLLPAIDRALARIRDGTYGACTGCGGRIPARRLSLRPEAERCVACVEESS